MKKFTDSDKEIARKIDPIYTWITRDKDYTIRIHIHKPAKLEPSGFWASVDAGLEIPFPYSFNSIKWIDEEPTRITDIYGEHKTKMKHFTDTEKDIARHIEEDGQFKYMARNKDGSLCLFWDRPYKEDIMWWSPNFYYYFPTNSMFTDIEWGDTEPTRIIDIYNQIRVRDV